jgi:hypothetical protein
MRRPRGNLRNGKKQFGSEFGYTDCETRQLLSLAHFLRLWFALKRDGRMPLGAIKAGGRPAHRIKISLRRARTWSGKMITNIINSLMCI